MKIKFFLILFTVAAFAGILSAKELKVLMIGNSFSICLGKYLPQIVAADPDNKLILTSAYIGGCSLERHHKNLLRAEKDPSFKPYRITVWDSAKDPVKGKSLPGNLNTLLKNEQFDIITIQQYSSKSWDVKSYEPFAGELIKFIRGNQKNAEIVIHQTWAYRMDAPLLKKWGFNQQEMYKRVDESCRQIARKYSLRIIPAGKAIQIFRENTPEKYQPIDKTVTYKEPQLPDFSKDPVGISLWQTTKAKGRHLHHDYTHLNNSGHYLQAAVWYLFLFDAPVSKIKITPKKMSEKDSAFLLDCAQKAVSNYKQIK